METVRRSEQKKKVKCIFHDRNELVKKSNLIEGSTEFKPPYSLLHFCFEGAFWSADTEITM